MILSTLGLMLLGYHGDHVSKKVYGSQQQFYMIKSGPGRFRHGLLKLCVGLESLGVVESL